MSFQSWLVAVYLLRETSMKRRKHTPLVLPFLCYFLIDTGQLPIYIAHRGPLASIESVYVWSCQHTIYTVIIAAANQTGIQTGVFPRSDLTC